MTTPNPATRLLFVRPSTKLVKVQYVISLLIVAAAWAATRRYSLPPAAEYAAYGAAGLWLLRTVFRHLGLRMSTLSCDGDRLVYEHGFLSKTMRALNLNKIQDARVDQSVWGRLIGVGTLTLESAGESGRLEMTDIDQPRRVADQILALARQKSST